MSQKTICITGASSGIGRELAFQYGCLGHNLILLARRKDLLEDLKNDIEKHQKIHSKITIYTCDISSEEQLKDWEDSLKETITKIDIFIANAGFGVGGSFEKLNVEDYRRQFETNVFGLMSCLKLALPHVEAAKGQLVVVGSVNSFISLPYSSAYCMSKFALHALCDALYYELAPKGIGVTLICPGFVDSQIRKVDNRGMYRKEWKDPIPSTLVVPTNKAVKEIRKAIRKRKKIAIITTHGKVFYFINKFFPFLTNIVKKKRPSV